jgi:hypothetical protein
MNFLRGFNRLFVVFAVLWATYFLVLSPFAERSRDRANYQSNQDNCRDYPNHPATFCLESAKERFDNTRKMAADSWWISLRVTIISIPLIYGLCRVLGAVGGWVWRGLEKTA